MATVTLTLTETCSGGGHFTLTMTGDATGSKQYDIAEIRSLMQSVGRETIAAVMLRLVQQGRTNVQLRDLLLAGITVTL